MPLIVLLSACAQGRAAGEKHGSDVKLSSDVVQGAVIFEPGTKDGAVVPEISAPQLRAVMVEESIVGNRLVERHREWILDEKVQFLGIPKEPQKSQKQAQKPAGGNHEN